ncbi:hypothetical protein FQN54_001543 [Arachnomyces sp. PD_36]|nr:hypothetical protein FQN54_001543 [Arachnomyces sp. PD_36]
MGGLFNDELAIRSRRERERRDRALKAEDETSTLYPLPQRNTADAHDAATGTGAKRSGPGIASAAYLSQGEGPNIAPSQPSESQPLPEDYAMEGLPQPSTQPISQSQLEEEVRAIYAGLVEVEKKCREIDQQQSRHAIIEKNTDETEIFEIPGILGQKHPTNALGDYCAKRNFMKKGHAVHLGLPIDRTKRIAITIGSGKQITTIGTTQATFRFYGETQSYPLLFHIIPSCIHDVILGKAFLKATNTFSSVTKFARRVKRRVLEGIKQRHFLYLGDSAPRFSGLINGLQQDALADSGAKISIMDEEFALSVGIPISRGSEHRTTLRYADCSTVETSGMAYGVEWEFGRSGWGKKFLLDLHILKNAPARVILSDGFLFRNQAFSQYNCYLVDDEEEDEDAYCFAIDLDVKYDGQGLFDMSSVENLEALEVVRRAERKDEIEKLLVGEQDAAWAQETECRSQWEKTMHALRASPRRSNAGATISPADPAGGKPPGPQIAGDKSVLTRLKFRLKRRNGT